MPKPSRYTLIWSDGHQHYDLHSYGQPEHCFRPGDEAAFSCWLVEHSSFAFWGRAGRIFVLKEARRGGRGYWYAYHTQDRHTHKRYLGPSARVTFARLEQEARTLTSKLSPPFLALPPPTSPIETGQEEPRKASKPPTEQRVPLLSSKFSPPRLPIWLVERSRLLDDLDVALSRSLTLVSASAGSGKTTLLSAWMAASKKRQAAKEMAQGTVRVEQAMAWLSLDALDNEPIRFWASVIAALRTCVPTLGQHALALLHAPLSPPLSTTLLVLLTDILEESRDLILILDDYHVIEDEAIHEAMSFLIDHLPDTLHLVLATRTNPAFPLSRLRALGQLLEIRHSDLRFTRAETACFLRDGMRLPLSAEEVTTLQQRTEGWIVGLHLAALSLHKREDPTSFVKTFAGSHRDLLDYVQQDILARLPQELQEFLLQTSIATRMNAAFCQALTALPTQKESQERLLEVERANLFVVPLDDDRQWYRYHDLFREALQARLHATHPELVPLLHQRAARFYEAAGELPEAIAHALLASDYLYAASLIEQAAPASWLCGEARTVLSWVLALPDTVLSAHLRLALNASLRLINSINLSNETQYTSLRSQMERIFTRLEGILQRQPESFSDAEVTLIRRRLRLLWVLIEGRVILKRGDTERLKLLAEEIEALPQDEEVNWSIIPLTLTFWLKVYLLSEGASLIPQLLATKQLLMQTGDHLVAIRVRVMLAYAYTRAAQWSQAKQECLEVLAQIEQIDVHTIWSGYVYYNLLICSYAQNRLEEASRWLQHLLQSAQDWQQVELQVRGEICSIQLALARGDLSTTQEALSRLETLVEQDGYAYHAPWVSSLRVQYWLASRNLHEASQWAAQTTFSLEAWNPFRKEEVLMLVRVLLAQKHYSRAVETLERFREHLNLSADIKTSIEFLVLSVVALHFAGKRAQALGSAASLLQLPESEGFIRVLLDAGEAMKQILLTWLSAARSVGDEALSDDSSCASPVSSSEFPLSLSSILRWLSAFEQEERRHTLPPQRAARQAPVSSLSGQEIRVLRLLVAGRTYAEMAKALIVSPNTIKTQVSTIYRKLGVSRRAEAIAVTAHAQLLL